ncbi:MAG: 23S rRNA (guanosine(2251)-2'-O)-methyltransferase RlmB [Proteocatella sp.]|jgi:23S rRNA (guanosine2251-2'-O)-methyltransferase|nr:23S rRNA (guanosine(2251)-2'-O)-methyltransferase RlmB [Proteocatella sp.]MBP7907615.1 23S rRNA (guanosine(2251)-2'-O)-methyltransferase RlmB [Proteocatella sp.]MBP8653613.1 23S rRNA (guanosine(2251)-2'-O)-methyltransferase RlmB [Proteocatella sp.]MBP9658188.1 23S rRNA (guanosine(2251)-2'-O)-methyltransferase RlmB [Proteocatella sp.]MBP9966187.1 23S rRNA (guanosine(2251)-2'-O)-methyltransferase RlmB [Proteocatella sp.]
MQIEGRNAVLEALKNGREIDYIYIKKGENEGSINKIIGKAKDMKIMIKVVDKNKLDEMSESKNHQGIIAVANEYRYFELEEILEQTREKAGFFLILDEIEDPHNLGAIIRSAEASGVDAIIIPKRRACQVNATVEKTAAGATSHIKIVRVTNLAQTIEKLKESGIWIYSVDMDGADYTKTDLKGKIALVIGNEGKGISRLVKEKSDFTVSIPMKGHINSLNASVAASILMFEAVRQRG